MEVHENSGIRYYIDDVAKKLAKKYDPSNARGPQGLTGDFMEECAVLPFVLAALNTGSYWGFDIEGYNSIVDIFARNSQASTHMSFARGVVKCDKDLGKLAENGHLRHVEHDGRVVYFPSENLVRSATQ